MLGKKSGKPYLFAVSLQNTGPEGTAEAGEQDETNANHQQAESEHQRKPLRRLHPVTNPAYHFLRLWIRTSLKGPLDRFPKCLSLLNSPTKHQVKNSKYRFYGKADDSGDCTSTKT